MDVFFARIVMPRSFSRSLLSMIRSVPETASFARNVPDCFSRQSTSVVLPWSTCAMIAMLRIPDIGPAFGPRGHGIGRLAGLAGYQTAGTGARFFRRTLLLPEAAREEGHEILPSRREVHREGQFAVGLSRKEDSRLRPGLGVQQLTLHETHALGRNLDVERAHDARREEIRGDVAPLLAVVGEVADLLDPLFLPVVGGQSRASPVDEVVPRELRREARDAPTDACAGLRAARP